MRYRTIIAALLTLVVFQGASANNIAVSNVSLIGKNVSAGTNNPANFVFLRFDVSWDNSWRASSAPSNWDAAWVFVKYRLPGGQWAHATLDTSSFTAPAGSIVTPARDGKGVFISRSSDGSGSVDFRGVKIRWDYGLDGVPDTANVNVQVFSIEMVYVPTGSFYVGSGGTESGSLTNGSWTSGATIPYQIVSENALTIAPTSGSLWGTSTGATISTIGGSGTLAASFPKGYGAFYCMKYSISQKQYVDFLNTLTYSQQATRTAVAPSSAQKVHAMYSGAQAQDRNGIEIKTSGVATTTPAVYACNLNDDLNFDQADDGLHLSCNWLSWADDIAYADWAGLRPMSELEFEKACRGPVSPTADEYAWGNTSYRSDSVYANAGTSSEVALPSTANVNVGHPIGMTFGPTRVGIFATGTSSRSQAGASYYGVMELGGDVWERVVSLGSSTGVDAGRSFAGSHGDGTLSASGDATGNADWPGTTAVGSGFRGGDWDADPATVRTSDRTVGALVDVNRGGNSDINGTRGFRCVRTAP